MLKIKYCNKKNNENNEITTNQYDYQNYVKPVYCRCCDIMIHSNTIIFHNRSDFHKTAQHLRNTISEPIKDIKQKVLEYKMIQKYMKKTFNNDSSSNSEQQASSTPVLGSATLNEQHEENEITDENLLKKIKRKSEAYKRELEHRAERYDRTKGISILVDSIKNATKRLTKLQIERYNNYLVKYPDNELLYSVQHLVPPHDAMLVLNTNVPKNDNK